MLNPGDRFDRYRVVRKLGEGGMATVYEAENAFGLSVVLKLLNPDLANDPDIVERFRREGRIQFTLKHPHIVRVTDIVEDRGVPALVIDFLRGRDLEVALEHGESFSVAESLDMVIKLLDGLHVAHEHGFIHRDLKPSNIFLEKTDLGYEPRLMDFGIAKIQQASALTRAQEFCGTPAYSSPEQIESTRDVDRRSDVYSMGIVLWQLLAHRQPWGEYEDPIRIMMAVVREPLAALPASIPLWLRQVVERATSKQVDGRFPSAAAFKEALLSGITSDPSLRDHAALTRPPVGDDTPPPGTPGRGGRATVLTPTASAETVPPSNAATAAVGARVAPNRVAAAANPPTAFGAKPTDLPSLATTPVSHDETDISTALAAAKAAAKASAKPAPASAQAPRPAEPTPTAPTQAPAPAPAAVAPAPTVAMTAAPGSRAPVLPPTETVPLTRRVGKVFRIGGVAVAGLVLVPLLGVMAWDMFKPPATVPEGFVRVEPGSYTRGSPPTELGRLADEVQQAVAISYPLAVQQHEVTVAEYHTLLAGRASPFAACGDNCPAINVSWIDAIEYANMRSVREGHEPCFRLVGNGNERVVEMPDGLECTGYRLPTEAEWEYFARAGSTTALPNGELTVAGRTAVDPLLAQIALYGANSHAGYLGAVDCSNWGEGFDTCGPTPVGTRQPNAWGIYDTSGSVAEWTLDAAASWDATPATDPLGPLDGRSRIVRGGSWMDIADRCRSAARRETQPLGRIDVGFRLVRRIRE